MLTQPAFLWAASDPAVTSIVKRGKFIHDDVLCQDALGMPVDLTTPSAMNVINCKSPDGTMTLSDLRQRGAQVRRAHDVPALQDLPRADGSLRARAARTSARSATTAPIDEAGRPIDPTVTFVPRSPLAPQMVTGAQPFAQALAASGVIRGCSVQKIASYAIGEHDPDLQHLRGERPPGADERHDHVAVQDGGHGQLLARAHGRYEVSSYKFKRRSFLRACGGSAALLAPLLRSIEARAQGVTAPLRLLILHHPLGAAPGLATWRPNASATTTNFTLPFESAPFEAAGLKPYMCMVDGLNMVFATRNSSANSGQNTHEGGMAVMMTGVPVLGRIGQQDHAAGGASIDQLLLDNSPMLGGPTQTTKTPFGSLQLAADVRSDRDEVAPRVLSYRPPLTGQSDISKARQPLHPETQPLNVYKPRLRRHDPDRDRSRRTVLAQKLSVLDYMRGDLARMQTLIPASEKDRLAAHADAITQLEASIRQTYGIDDEQRRLHEAGDAAQLRRARARASRDVEQRLHDLSGVDYYVPNMPTQPPAPRPRPDPASPDQDGVRLRSTCASRPSCGRRARTGSCSPGRSRARRSRATCSRRRTTRRATAATRATNNWLNQINTFYSSATATALQEFVTQPDIDGDKLIDNTIIVYLTEVARAYDHNQQNMPLIVFGGKNTGVKGGTFLKVTGGLAAAADGRQLRQPAVQRPLAGAACPSSASTAAC